MFDSIEEVRRVMDQKNPAIARVIILKEMLGLYVTEQQVYYLIDCTGKEHLKDLRQE